MEEEILRKPDLARDKLLARMRKVCACIPPPHMLSRLQAHAGVRAGRILMLP